MNRMHIPLNYTKLKGENSLKQIKLLAIALCVIFVISMLGACNREDFADANEKIPMPKRLSKKLDKQIREDYLSFFEAKYPDETISANFFHDYNLGTYKGAVAIYLIPRLIDDTLHTTKTMGGYSYTVYIYDSDIYLYKDGIFTEADKPYEQGIITEQDAKKIAWLWNNQGA